jgi:hypothetical protein
MAVSSQGSQVQDPVTGVQHNPSDLAWGVMANGIGTVIFSAAGVAALWLHWGTVTFGVFSVTANGWDVLPSGVNALIVAIPVVAFISFCFVAVGAALSSHPLRTVSAIASPFLRLVGLLALIATIFVIVDGHTWQYYTGGNKNIVRGVVAVLPFLTFVQAGRARRRARAIGRHPGAAIDWRGVPDGGANPIAAITGPQGRTPTVSNLSGNPSSSAPASAHQVCPKYGRDDSANARRCRHCGADLE